MLIKNQPYRSIWVSPDDERVIQVIDQRYLPHQLIIKELLTSGDAIAAIRDMYVRGAPLIGATAAFGLYLAALEAPENDHETYVKETADELYSTRPTAVNLGWAIKRMLKVTHHQNREIRGVQQAALREAKLICDEDVAICKRIGEHGLTIIEDLAADKNGSPINILTHCNAGWLACVDWGTATSPIYQAHEKGIPIHVWVDETRPRNQGANLTAWELGQHGVPHTVIVDNAGGHLMQHGKVDMVITGTDRTTRNGDVANKIGTYLKALAAKDNNIPFYVALPSTTIDWSISDGLHQIKIEERSQDEVKKVSGWCEGEIKEVLLMPAASPAANYGFDVTPARLITAFITERGICAASENGILNLFPELQEAINL